MKKLLLIVLALVTTSLYADPTSNYREVGSFTTNNNIKVTVGVDMRRITKIVFQGKHVLHLDTDALANFGVMLDINMTMIDAVVSNNTDVIFLRNTDRFNYNLYKTVMSYFRTNGTGGEDSCYVEFRFILNTAGFETTKIVLQAADIRQLQQLISEAESEASNITEQLAILQNTLDETKRY